MFRNRNQSALAYVALIFLCAPIALHAASLFTPIRNYNSGGANATSMVVADVNDDGKPDVVVANTCWKLNDSCAEGGVSVFLGQGNGTFQKPVTYSSGGQSAVSVAVSDVNRDGKLDVIVANTCMVSGNCPAGGGVAVLLGNGDGTFRAATIFSSGGDDANSVTVADVNGDGAPDLLVVNICITSDNCESGIIGVLLGNGDGTFQPVQTYNSGGLQGFSITVGDVNQDGKPDLLVANLGLNQLYGEGGVGVLLGNGDGTFQTVQSYSTGGEEADSIAVADVNGDGKPDLLVSNDCFDLHCQLGGAGGISLLLGNGDGTFQPAITFESGGAEAQSIAVADVNRDGKLDLVVANLCVTSGNCVHGIVSILLGNGDGTFSEPLRFSSNAWYTHSVAVADLNGDGAPDLVIADECITNTMCGDTNGAIGVLLHFR